MNEMKLTPKQVAAMNSDSPWLKTTPEQEKFIRECPKGHVITLYDDAFIQVTEDRMAAAMETAFKTAASSAAQQLGLTTGHEFKIECDQPELGQAFLRVTVTDDCGRKASAIGIIPDPRTN